MRTLQRVLASGVLDALRARAHVQVAPQCGDALRDEVEAIIAPALQSIRPHLGDGDPGGLHDDGARDAMASIVDRITEQLLASDHLDDIFADDRVIRRDAFRAIRDILLGYIRGEVDVEEEEELETDGFEVRLDGLGYLVSHASRRLSEPLLAEALDRAAATTGASFVEYDPARHAANFAHVGGPAAGRLALEEAITEELSELVEAEVVTLPGLQQVLEVERGSVSQPGFDRALERASRRIQRVARCSARCAIMDSRLLLARLTPLSDESAERAGEHFTRFLELLEEELAKLDEDAERPAPRSKKPRSAAKKKSTAAARPAAKRGAAMKASPPIPSRTRARNGKAARRRDAK